MFETVEIPVWVVVITVIFAVIAIVERMLIPSVRWFLRRRMERIVARINKRLTRPIAPFKLARRHDMIQQLLYHPDVMKAVAIHAKENNVPENVAFETARKHARVIVPSFSLLAYFTIAERLAKILSKILYSVQVNHIDETLAEIEDDATVIFIMNHRSNMDYVLVTYLAAQKSTLSYAVGEWANVWPLSRLIRASGAYLISRKPKGALYSSILTRYVKMATQGGVTQAIFPEGGLSLDGRLKDPKMGLLSYVVSAWEEDGRDIVFVPTALNYDRVLEDYILVNAAKKGERSFGTNTSVIIRFIGRQIRLWITGRYKRFGTAVVNFTSPISLRELSKQTPAFDTQQIANELMSRISAAIPILPVPFAAQVLQMMPEGSHDEYKALAGQVYEKYKNDLRQLSHDTAEEMLDLGLAILLGRKLVANTDQGYRITQKGDEIVPYYAATLEHMALEFIKQ